MKSLSIAIATIAGIASACAPAAPNTIVNTTNTINTNRMAEVTPRPEAAPVETLASGKEFYALNCMICHKDTGQGGKLTLEGKTIDPDDLTTAKMKAMSDEKLTGYVVNGIEDEGMPSFKGKLTDEEIKSVIAHVRTLQN